MASRRKPTPTTPSGTATEIHADTSQSPPGPIPTRDWAAFADSLPSVLQPLAVLLVGIVRASLPLFRGLWRAAKGLGRVGWSIITLLAPLFVWAGSKWVRWYIMSYVKKAQRILGWVVWFLGFLPKGSPAPGADAEGSTAPAPGGSTAPAPGGAKAPATTAG